MPSNYVSALLAITSTAGLSDTAFTAQTLAFEFIPQTLNDAVPSAASKITDEVPVPVFCVAATSQSAFAGKATVPELNTTVFVPASVILI
jgi:hypothetical protein